MGTTTRGEEILSYIHDCQRESLNAYKAVEELRIQNKQLTDKIRHYAEQLAKHEQKPDHERALRSEVIALNRRIEAQHEFIENAKTQIRTQARTITRLKNQIDKLKPPKTAKKRAARKRKHAPAKKRAKGRS